MRLIPKAGQQLLATALCALWFTAQAITGSPPRVTFDRPDDTAAQLYGIERDDLGVIFIGSSEGVLSFDGEVWQTLPVDGEHGVRTLLTLDDRLFVGGYNQFGEMRREASGRRVFVDLTADFADAFGEREFADVWQIVSAPEGIYFRALRDLFLLPADGGESKHWFHADRFGALAHHSGETWIQFRGEGMRRKVGDDWLPVAGTDHLTELIFELMPMPGGGFISFGRTGEYWHISAAGTELLTMPVGLPPSTDFEHAALLSDGSLALASGDGSLYIVDAAREEFRRLRVQNGFLSDVHAVPGGVLVVMDSGFQFVRWPSALTVLDETQGLPGSFNSIRWMPTGPQVSTSAGVFAVDASAASLRFVSIAGPATSTHDVWPLGPNAQLVAGDHRLLKVTNGTLSRVSEELIYPRLLSLSAAFSDRLYVGTEDGLRVVTFNGEEMSLLPLVGEPLARRVDAIVEVAADEVWIGSGSHGVWRYSLDSAGQIVASEMAGADIGLDYGSSSQGSVARLPDGRLASTTAAGLFVRRGKRFEPLELGNLHQLREFDELLHLAFDERGNGWAYSDRRLLHAAAGEAWAELPARRLRQGAFRNHAFSDDGSALFVSGAAIVIHRPTDSDSVLPAPHVRLVQVAKLTADGARSLLDLEDRSPAPFQAADLGLEFRFSMLDLSRRSGSQYRGQLVGYEAAPTDWTTSSSYTYWNLSPGDYRLELEGRDSQGRISAIEPYRFVIEPPWYLSPVARLGWILLAGLGLWLLVRRIIQGRTRRFLEDKSRLEQTVAKRTHELALANRQLQQMANVDGLTGVSNRRALDEYYHAVFLQCVERERSLALIAIDADHFKRYNDSHGHLAGDELLRRLVDTLSHCLRRSEDQLGRFGGEEFLVVLPGATLELAAELAERMRAAVEQADLGVTISLGVAACIPQAGESTDQLLARADAALYAAKHGGRNRVKLADADVDDDAGSVH